MEVLVVEDSSFARMAVTKVVGGLLPNAEFFEAADGKTGLALFQTMRPELVLTDLLMPTMTGEDLIRAIRQLDATVPIIVMSAGVRLEQYRAQGADELLAKPFDINTLVGYVKQYLPD